MRGTGRACRGRAAGWKAFVRTLDELPMTAEQEAELDRGAIAAFERFNVLLQYAYADAPVADMARA